MNLEHCLWFSCSFSLFLCTTFVGLLYLPWFYGERNDCKIIKRRSLALLSLGTFFYSVTDFVIISYLFELNEEQKKLVRTSSLANFFDSFSPILLLFLGPFSLNIIEIVTYYLRGVSIEESLKLSLPLLGQDSWIIVRNLIVAPVSEELVFRGCICKLLSFCTSSRSAVLLSSAFFAASHCHHFIYRNFVYNSLRTAILETVIQFLYTFLFGVYSAWVFIRSRRVITSICLHSFCNFVGTPDLSKIWSHCYRWPLLLTYFIGISLFLHSVFHVS
ncbi:prenyl protein peptidase [Galdieria sulphuraria]|uniref:intramembrane prenyl-peptidase Rce1 n=1 Tax=Galdieria sulphuraria TaxID=130081 RepID=M2Y8U2_GALSU|nr:prenyl protein peptidase [Galdieria sulphuraria]EME32259.1 prenyl protein peptidase [Galdieria sulphuraria]|eukprot:XP_005708779.1 prenyl protein peptidase [Galdieria sulphuraria]